MATRSCSAGRSPALASASRTRQLGRGSGGLERKSIDDSNEQTRQPSSRILVARERGALEVDARTNTTDALPRPAATRNWSVDPSLCMVAHSLFLTDTRARSIEGKCESPGLSRSGEALKIPGARALRHGLGRHAPSWCSAHSYAAARSRARTSHPGARHHLWTNGRDACPSRESGVLQLTLQHALAGRTPRRRIPLCRV